MPGPGFPVPVLLGPGLRAGASGDMYRSVRVPFPGNGTCPLSEERYVSPFRGTARVPFRGPARTGTCTCGTCPLSEEPYVSPFRGNGTCPLSGACSNGEMYLRYVSPFRGTVRVPVPGNGTCPLSGACSGLTLSRASHPPCERRGKKGDTYRFERSGTCPLILSPALPRAVLSVKGRAFAAEVTAAARPGRWRRTKERGRNGDTYRRYMSPNPESCPDGEG